MGCLDDNLVAAFVDGRVGEAAREATLAHIADCTTCAELVGVAVTVTPGDTGASPTGSALPRGFTIGRYVILDLVGRGGMGEVYSAYDPQLDRKVALKVLHASAARKTSNRDRLLREAKVIARLSHPNVVVVHDAGQMTGPPDPDDPTAGERLFLAMEFIDGETLAAWLKAAPRTWREIRTVFLAAGEGLVAAHEAGLVHRDFKPQNVMVGRDGAVRVTDFGLASDGSGARTSATGDDPDGAVPEPRTPLTEGTLALTRTGVLLGTPLYMSPEQFQVRPVDARSDQFSFCVALFEAIYGARPFPGDTIQGLATAVIGGRLHEPAQKGRAPVYVRKLLARGLRPDPAARWRSMRELLDALAADPARLRKRAATAATAVAIVAAAVLATQHHATRGARLCLAGGERLAAAWDLTAGGAGRRVAERAFLATGKTFAAETWQRVAALLDDYGRRWTAQYQDACEATHVRGDQSPAVLDLRMTCLDGRLASLRALTQELARADARLLIEAVNAARALPELERCADVPALQTAGPLPPNTATRAQVDGLVSELAAVKALEDTGRWAAAEARLGPLVASARATEYGPLLAETLALRGWLEYWQGTFERAVATYQDALFTAMGAHRDDIALDAATILCSTLGYELGRPDEAVTWARFAESLLARLGPGHERSEAWLFQARGTTAARGDPQTAERHFARAVALKRKVLPANHPDIAISIDSLAAAQADQGDFARALTTMNEALDIQRQAYGAESPILAVALGNRGEILSRLGRHQEAEQDLRSSIARWGAWVGPDHIWVAHALTTLGEDLVAQGRPREAIGVLERALRIRTHGEPTHALIAETQIALARARWDVGTDRPGARTLALTAHETFQAEGKKTRQAAEAETWLAAHPAQKR